MTESLTLYCTSASHPLPAAAVSIYIFISDSSRSYRLCFQRGKTKFWFRFSLTVSVSTVSISVSDLLDGYSYTWCICWYIRERETLSVCISWVIGEKRKEGQRKEEMRKGMWRRGEREEEKKGGEEREYSCLPLLLLLLLLYMTWQCNVWIELSWIAITVTMTVTVPKYAKIKYNLFSRKQQTKRDILYRLGGVENFVRFYSTLFYLLYLSLGTVVSGVG